MSTREEELTELLKIFVEREISLHSKDDQPYSVDWVLIQQAEETIGENYRRRWGKSGKHASFLVVPPPFGKSKND